MLKVVTGRFHPSLESSLIAHIQLLKASDPWTRVAILVPSKPLLDRIKRLLAIDHRLSLLNLDLLTFHQFALRLVDEPRRPATPSFRIVSELFFEQLMRDLVNERLADCPALEQLGRSFGTWTALWSTSRDLKDGGVNPATALQALGEGCFDREDHEWLHTLFTLQTAVQKISSDLKVGTADDLAEALIPSIATSPFLSSLNHVCYYGFYDLTQVQLSLFQAVTAAVPTTLFFPLDNTPSFAFARRFFDRHVQPLLGADPPIEASVGDAEVSRPEVSVQSVIGPEEELSAVCRAILDLIETHGYHFHDIGVVARTLDPYSTLVQTVFARYRIPLMTTAHRPLIHQPLCKTLLLMATLPVNDFYRTAVLDIVTSPFYARPDSRLSAAYRPEQWKAVVDALNITHGLDEWERLKRWCQSTLEVDGEGDEIGALGSVKIAPEVIALLWNSVSRLLADCCNLPTKGDHATLLQAFRRLAHEHLRWPNARGEQPSEETRVLATVWEAIDQTMASLEELSILRHNLTWQEFAEVVTHAFERGSVSVQPPSPQGVMFVDAMAARGVPFRALFVLGLNEKVFPRYIREDAFLRDRQRRVLETTLGYKVDEKLPGYDEESLLFTLLSQAAVRRLYLSFQRADENGRMLAPSPFLGDLRQQSQPVDVIPRRLTEQMTHRPAMSRFLPPSDLAQWMAVTGKNPEGLLDAAGMDAVTFHNGMEALDRTESDQSVLTAFDGLTNPLGTHWSRVTDRGIAPTPLERYARCPFRYFSADVLKLGTVRGQTSDEPDVRVLGTFCHGALRRCYELLLPTGWPGRPVTDDTIDWCIETAVEEAAAEIERQHRTGHYLLWELAKASIVDVMTAAVDEDTRAYHDAPFAPVAFEVLAEGTMSDVPGCGSAPLKIRGRIDRLDRHRDTGILRVIDYKLKAGKSISSEDRHLVQSAIRGYRLQPPLYAQLQIPTQGLPRQVQLFFLAPNWPNPIARSTFDTDALLGDSGILLRQTLGQLINGIKGGRFFIMPDTYCKSCEFRVACRREHTPTWWRTSRTVESKELAALRTLQVDQ